MTEAGNTILSHHCLPSSQNLRDLLVQVELKPPVCSPPGNQKCGGSRCKTCPTLMCTAKFTSHSTGKQHQMKSAASCKTENDLSHPLQEVWTTVCGRDWTGTSLQNEQPPGGHHPQEDQGQTSGRTFQYPRTFSGRPGCHSDRVTLEGWPCSPKD